MSSSTSTAAPVANSAHPQTSLSEKVVAKIRAGHLRQGITNASIYVGDTDEAYIAIHDIDYGLGDKRIVISGNVISPGSAEAGKQVFEKSEVYSCAVDDKFRIQDGIENTIGKLCDSILKQPLRETSLAVAFFKNLKDDPSHVADQLIRDQAADSQEHRWLSSIVTACKGMTIAKIGEDLKEKASNDRRHAVLADRSHAEDWKTYSSIREVGNDVDPIQITIEDWDQALKVNLDEVGGLIFFHFTKATLPPTFTDTSGAEKSCTGLMISHDCATQGSTAGDLAQTLEFGISSLLDDPPFPLSDANRTTLESWRDYSLKHSSYLRSANIDQCRVNGHDSSLEAFNKVTDV